MDPDAHPTDQPLPTPQAVTSVPTPRARPAKPSGLGRQRRRFYLFFSVVLVVSFLFGLLGVPMLHLPVNYFDYFPELSRLEQMVGVLLALPVLWLAIFVHELGHVVAGRGAGFKIVRVTVGPLLIRTLKRSLEVKYNRLGNMLMGRVEVYTDAPEDPRLARKHAGLIVGGPVASLLLTAGSFGLVGLSGLQGHTLDELYAWELWGVLSISLLGTMSLWLAVFNLLPFNFSGCASDGLQLLKLGLKNARFLDDLRQEYRLQHLFYGQVAPRDWDLSLLRFDVRDDLRNRYISAFSRYYHHKQKGDVSAAKTYLDTAVALLEEWRSPLLPLLQFEKVCFYALYLGDEVTARALFEAGRQKVGDRDLQRAPKAALLLLEGEFAQALELIDLALCHLEWERDSGYIRAAREVLVRMRARAVAGTAAQKA